MKNSDRERMLSGDQEPTTDTVVRDEPEVSEDSEKLHLHLMLEHSGRCVPNGQDDDGVFFCSETVCVAPSYSISAPISSKMARTGTIVLLFTICGGTSKASVFP